MNFVIVVDVQGDFIRADGALPVAGAEGLVAPMNAWLAALRPAETAGVLFTFDTHYADTYPSLPEAKLFPLHCVRGSDGWASVLSPDMLDPAIPRYRLEKGVFDMWAEPGVLIEPVNGEAVPREAFFERLRAAGVVEVTVTGVAADFCVRWAIDGLLARGFRVAVPAALTRGIEHDIAAVAQELGGQLALV